MLAAEMPVELVIATQERRSRAFFDDLPFPVELHFCPGEATMAEIMASCDGYCCTSWYDGLGLPGLECFCCGVPVVSTRTYGVMDYGVDEENLLLARPNDPGDLCRQLRRVLQDTSLADRLRDGGARTVASAYDWPTSVRRFKKSWDRSGTRARRRRRERGGYGRIVGAAGAGRRSYAD